MNRRAVRAYLAKSELEELPWVRPDVKDAIRRPPSAPRDVEYGPLAALVDPAARANAHQILRDLDVLLQRALNELAARRLDEDSSLGLTSKSTSPLSSALPEPPSPHTHDESNGAVRRLHWLARETAYRQASSRIKNVHAAAGGAPEDAPGIGALQTRRWTRATAPWNNASANAMPVKRTSTRDEPTRIADAAGAPGARQPASGGRPLVKPPCALKKRPSRAIAYTTKGNPRQTVVRMPAADKTMVTAGPCQATRRAPALSPGQRGSRSPRGRHARAARGQPTFTPRYATSTTAMPATIPRGRARSGSRTDPAIYVAW